VDWETDRAWIHARPSNTEPIMRIIAEAPDRSIAERKIEHVQQIVRKTLGA
jgi:phosphomannomutase